MSFASSDPSSCPIFRLLISISSCSSLSFAECKPDSDALSLSCFSMLLKCEVAWRTYEKQMKSYERAKMILLLSSRNRLKYVDIVGPEFDAVSLVCRDSSKVVSLANGKRHAIKWTNQSLMQIRGTKLGKTRVHWLCFTFVTFRFNFTTHRERALY